MNTIIDCTGEVEMPSGLFKKPHSGVMQGRTRHGKIDVSVECPYCGHTNYTALWSLAGSGKRCEGCFAHIGQTGAFKPTAKELKRLTKNDPRRIVWTEYYERTKNERTDASAH